MPASAIRKRKREMKRLGMKPMVSTYSAPEHGASVNHYHQAGFDIINAHMRNEPGRFYQPERKQVEREPTLQREPKGAVKYTATSTGFHPTQSKYR